MVREIPDEDPITIMAREEMLRESARYEAISAVEYDDRVLFEDSREREDGEGRDPSDVYSVQELCQIAVARYRDRQAHKQKMLLAAGCVSAIAAAVALTLVAIVLRKFI